MLICLLDFKKYLWKEGGRAARLHCPSLPQPQLDHGCRKPLHPFLRSCLSGSLKMLAKTKGRMISWGTWSFA